MKDLIRSICNIDVNQPLPQLHFFILIFQNSSSSISFQDFSSSGQTRLITYSLSRNFIFPQYFLSSKYHFHIPSNLDEIDNINILA